MSETDLEIVCRHQRKFKENEARFHKLFRPLKLSDFWNVKTRNGILIGFDVLKLDEAIKPRGNESLLPAILRKYGEEAREMAFELIRVAL